MILQALYDYYHRKAAQDEGGIAPLGFQRKEIPFLIVIDEDGRFIQLEDTREGDGKKKRAKSFLVPQELKRTGQHAWKTAFLLWDKMEYVFGYASDPAKADVAQKQKQSFIAKIRELPASLLAERSIVALLKFLESDCLEMVSKDPLWPEVINFTGGWFTFRLKGNPRIVCEEPAIFTGIKNSLQAGTSDDGPAGVCLITGKWEALARLHPSVKAFSATGVSVVSFNDSAYCSYGKEQSYNAPVSHDAANAYTAALNLLLAKDSKQKLSLGGDTTVVFWAERGSEEASEVEDCFAAFFADDKDDPDRFVSTVKSLYTSPYTGRQAIQETDDRFFVLGLSPNKARLAIRFCHVLPLDELKRKIRQHFEDLEICHGPKEQDALPLRRLIQELCLQHKLDNAPPNLEGAFFESIVLGAPYPMSILHAVMRRIRAEQAGDYPSVNYPRAALLKGFLNRWYRQEKTGKEFTVSLDENNESIGYCLGRLFAVLEKIQEDSSGISTIRGRFYGAASSTPAVAFPQLMKLKNHHLAKLDAPGKVIYFEKLISQVVSLIPESFPTHLSLFEQGAFSVGYYHQRQAFYTKKEAPAPELQTVE